MTTDGTLPRVGFTCAYTPLALVDAHGLLPLRLRPDGEAPEEAASLLHDNLCPHVKRVLDLRLAGRLDPLAGLVVVGSCEAMRRLADAWAVAAPEDPVAVVDLPVTRDEGAARYLAGELERLAGALAEWSGRGATPSAIEEAAARRDELARLVQASAAPRPGGGRIAAARIQELRNLAVTAPLEEAFAAARALAEEEAPAEAGAVPVFLHGNVLPSPEALALVEAAGARVVGDDLCTGSRQVAGPSLAGDGGVFLRLARGLLERPRCARTLSGRPLDIAEEVAAAAVASGARGVIAHVAKFCDPYLGRLPVLRRALREAGLPLLVLDGDCTLRSIGQGRTRIEAFVEMLADGAA